MKDELTEALEIMEEALPEAIKALRQIINDDSVPPVTRVRAASLLRRYIKEYGES